MVVDQHVVEEHPVDPALAGQPPVAGRLGLVVVADDLEDQRAAPLGQRRLHPGQELGEERVGPEQLRGPPHHQPDRERPRPRQRPCPGARLPAQVAGRGQDPVPGLGRHPRPVVERERHRPLGHPGPPGHVHDRRPPPEPDVALWTALCRAPGCAAHSLPCRLALWIPRRLAINRFSMEIRGYPRTPGCSVPGPGRCSCRHRRHRSRRRHRPRRQRRPIPNLRRMLVALLAALTLAGWWRPRPGRRPRPRRLG